MIGIRIEKVKPLEEEVLAGFGQPDALGEVIALLKEYIIRPIGDTRTDALPMDAHDLVAVFSFVVHRLVLPFRPVDISACVPDYGTIGDSMEILVDSLAIRLQSVNLPVFDPCPHRQREKLAGTGRVGIHDHTEMRNRK